MTGAPDRIWAYPDTASEFYGEWISSEATEDRFTPYLKATPAREHAEELVAALKRAQTFIRNGVELGFIKMPDLYTPDPAHDTPQIIDNILAKIK